MAFQFLSSAVVGLGFSGPTIRLQKEIRCTVAILSGQLQEGVEVEVQLDGEYILPGEAHVMFLHS